MKEGKNRMTTYDYAIFLALVAIAGFTVWNVHNREIVNSYGTTVADLKPLPETRSTLAADRMAKAFEPATKIEIDQLRRELNEATTNMSNSNLARATDEIAQEKKIAVLEDEVKTLHSRITDLIKNRKAEPKQVHVSHSYTTPMQVDLSYPDNVQTKGKGKAALLKQAGVR